MPTLRGRKKSLAENVENLGSRKRKALGSSHLRASVFWWSRIRWSVQGRRWGTWQAMGRMAGVWNACHWNKSPYLNLLVLCLAHGRFCVLDNWVDSVGVQAHLRNIAGPVPDHCSETSHNFCWWKVLPLICEKSNICKFNKKSAVKWGMPVIGSLNGNSCLAEMGNCIGGTF